MLRSLLNWNEMKKWMGLLLAVLLVLETVSSVLAEDASSPVGTVEENVYTNEVLGFRAVFPDTWRILSDQELASTMGYEEQYASREGLNRLLETESAVCGLYAAAKEGFRSNANLMIADLGDYASLTEDIYLSVIKGSLPEVLKSQGYADVELTEQTFLLAGKEHAGAVLTGTIAGLSVHMAVIMIKADRYIGSLTIATPSEEETNRIIAVFETLNLAAVNTGEWGVIGTICGTNWDMDFPMTETSPGVWCSEPLELKAKDEFKVRRNGSWEENYGDLGVFNGTNVVVPVDGTYTVILDLNAEMLTFIDENGNRPEAPKNPSGDTWGVIGTICGTNWDVDFPMLETFPGIWVSSPLELKAGDEFKVRQNGAWAVNYGALEGFLISNGPNIPVTENGTFIITLDLNTLYLTITAP